jgi:hypothetical protein
MRGSPRASARGLALNAARMLSGRSVAYDTPGSRVFVTCRVTVRGMGSSTPLADRSSSRELASSAPFGSVLSRLSLRPTLVASSDARCCCCSCS